MIKIVRTNSENMDFVSLVEILNKYLKIMDGIEHDFYHQYNKIDNLKHVVVAYENEKPVACGAFKEFNKETTEIKRMFTLNGHRNKGIASKILIELENWSIELSYTFCILETGRRQIEALEFYKKMNYLRIPNYAQYKNKTKSLCFKKELTGNEKR